VLARRDSRREAGMGRGAGARVFEEEVVLLGAIRRWAAAEL
jgi:hypothetical protein